MGRIVIDARESGTSTGRYIDKLIEHLHSLRPQHEIIVLAKSHRLDFLHTIAPTFTVIETPFKEFTFGEQLGFKKQIDGLHADLVHFGMVQQPVLYRGRVVTTMHDLTTTRFKNPSKNGVVFTVMQIVYKWVNKKVAKKSTAIITPTQYVKDDVVDFTGVNPDKITVTLESAEKITESAKPVKAVVGKRFIMYVGNATPHKNLERLIEAMPYLQETFPDLHLVLAGKKTANTDAHERRAKELGVKNIVFTGFVTEGELRWLYENTACYVFPSLSEGFGLPPLEAMIHGAPVAASNYTCIPEVLGDAAAYFDPTVISEVGDCIAKVLADNSFASDLRARGHKQAAKYSWKRMAEQTLGVYDSVL
jgi:glycosyltransferase involved in cell wall biosynthesis